MCLGSAPPAGRGRGGSAACSGLGPLQVPTHTLAPLDKVPAPHGARSRRQAPHLHGEGRLSATRYFLFLQPHTGRRAPTPGPGAAPGSPPLTTPPSFPSPPLSGGRAGSGPRKVTAAGHPPSRPRGHVTRPAGRGAQRPGTENR